LSIAQEAATWAPRRVLKDMEKREVLSPTGVQNLDCPARSGSLYGGVCVIMVKKWNFKVNILVE
jgi:hypothetical protein